MHNLHFSGEDNEVLEVTDYQLSALANRFDLYKNDAGNWQTCRLRVEIVSYVAHWLS